MAVIDVSTPESPILLSSVHDDATIALDAVSDVFVSGNYAYLNSHQRHTIEILDIADSPPSHVSSLRPSLTFPPFLTVSGPTDIYVVEPYAYVTNFMVPFMGLTVIDVTDPFTPTAVAFLNDTACDAVNGGECVLGGARAIEIVGNRAYITSGDIDHGLEIVNIANPLTPTHVGSIEDTACDLANSGECALGGAAGIDVVGDYAYIAARGDHGLEIIDISVIPHVGSIFNGDVPGVALEEAVDVKVVGDYAYVTARSSNAVTVIDVSDPSNPTFVTSLIDNSSIHVNGVWGIDVSGGNIFVSSGMDDSLAILNLNVAGTCEGFTGNDPDCFCSVHRA